jgi:hypothetical protein
MDRGAKMSHDADPTGIQQKPPAPAASHSGITTSPQAALLPLPKEDEGVHLSGVSFVHRLPVLGAGVALGATFALFMAGPMMPSGMRFADRVLVWAFVMGGPIVGTAWGMAAFHPIINLGWLGLFLIPAHPARPCLATGCVTMVGLFVWFFVGFVGVMVAVWGA